MVWDISHSFSTNNLSVASEVADAIVFSIADSDTPAGIDASNILGSVTQSGDDISVTLDALTISNTPATAVYWEMDIKNIYGDVLAGNLDLSDTARCILRTASLVPDTDIWVGMAFVDDTGANGAAYRIAAVAGDWQVQHTSNVAGAGWVAWTTSTANANTQGFVSQLVLGNGTTNGRVNAYGVDATGTTMASTATTAPTSVNIGNDLTKVRLCVGWIAGAIGNNPTTITFKAAHIHQKLLEFPAIGTFFA